MSHLDAIKHDIAFWTGFYNNKEDYFSWASKKAYLDMNRTLTFAKNIPADTKTRRNWQETGTQIIKRHFENLTGSFDDWHETTCKALIQYYGTENKLISRNKNEYVSLTYGQAQKWLNMTLKYIWLLYRLEQLNPEDAEKVKKYEKNFHVPLDSYILRYAEQIKKVDKTFPNNGLNKPLKMQGLAGSEWSKINDIVAYRTYQKALRGAICDGSFPLEWELKHWHIALEYYSSPSSGH